MVRARGWPAIDRLRVHVPPESRDPARQSKTSRGNPTHRSDTPSVSGIRLRSRLSSEGHQDRPRRETYTPAHAGTWPQARGQPASLDCPYEPGSERVLSRPARDRRVSASSDSAVRGRPRQVLLTRDQSAHRPRRRGSEWWSGSRCPLTSEYALRVVQPARQPGAATPERPARLRRGG